MRIAHKHAGASCARRRCARVLCACGIRLSACRYSCADVWTYVLVYSALSGWPRRVNRALRAPYARAILRMCASLVHHGSCMCVYDEQCTMPDVRCAMSDARRTMRDVRYAYRMCVWDVRCALCICRMHVQAPHARCSCPCVSSACDINGHALHACLARAWWALRTCDRRVRGRCS